MLMLVGSFFLTITLIVYGAISVPVDRKNKIKPRLAKLSKEPVPDVVQSEKGDGKLSSLARRLFTAFSSRFKRKFTKAINERKLEQIEQLLHQAGKPGGMGIVEFRLIQFITILALPGISFLYSAFVIRGSAGQVFFAVLTALLIGWRAPYMYLASKAKARARKALRELPDVLDLLTVSLEAGLGFDSAIAKLVSKKSGVLADEFHRMLEEIRLGRTRREALIGMRDRLRLDEMRTLVGSILQAEKLGIGMVQVLAVQSSEMRDRRKQRAEEAAMKAPIKMLFPLVFFIFPCLFIVLLGPVIIQFIETMGKNNTLP